jgi:hypothetical protein
MEVYEGWPLEQAVDYPEGHPDAVPPISPFSDVDRARLLMGVLRRAGRFVGEGGGPDLISRLDFMLGHARRGNMPASLYETIWELRCFFVEHSIIDRGVSR